MTQENTAAGVRTHRRVSQLNPKFTSQNVPPLVLVLQHALFSLSSPRLNQPQI